MKTLKLEPFSGFKQISTSNGTSITAFIKKSDITNEYLIDEENKISGLCSYSFLSAAGVFRGVIFKSPILHTAVTPLMLKIGMSSGPFHLNTNLQQLGLLIYESPSGGVFCIPTDVSSTLLVEVT
jgi:hypothetical protein